MKQLLLVAVTAALFAVNAVPPPPPQHGFGGGMPPGASMSMDPIVRMVMDAHKRDALKLTDEQVSKLKELADARRKNAGETHKQLRAAMEKQTNLLKADKIDEATVMKAVDEVFEIRKQLAKLQTKRIIDIRNILTPEQIALAREEISKDRKARHGGEHRRPDGQGMHKRNHGNLPPPPPPPDGEGPKDGPKDGPADE